MSLAGALAARGGEIQGFLDSALAEFGGIAVVQAMGHAASGGKRLRGFFVLETASLHGTGAESALPAAAAVEAMHAYSLVHDDLPCMDNADLRRGQSTVHVKWNEATAVLAGDALQSLAFGLLAREEIGAPDVRIGLVESLARASGAEGMVLGQAQDIEAESAAEPLTLDGIAALQRNKTGALIEWSCAAGAIIARADPGPLRQYARAVGLAFQIADDILDVEGDDASVGKSLGRDEEAGKATFVSLLGVGGAKAEARRLAGEAEAALERYGAGADVLREAARFVISRRM